VALLGSGAALAVLFSSSAAPSERSAGAIRFRIATASGTIAGEFGQWRVLRAIVDEERPERSVVDLAIDLAELATGDERLDRDLWGPAWFDVARRREAIVHLREVRVEDGAHFVATATIQFGARVHAAPVRFTLTDASERRVAGRMTLRRSDLGLPADGSGATSGDDLEVTIDAVILPNVGVAAAGSCVHGSRG
jgi:polyisoprenoid-binding protein YceI